MNAFNVLIYTWNSYDNKFYVTCILPQFLKILEVLKSQLIVLPIKHTKVISDDNNQMQQCDCLCVIYQPHYP